MQDSVGCIGAPKLRQYQETALFKLEQAFDEGKKRPLLVAPCGAGKTTIFAEIARRNKGKILFVAHRRELIDQAHDRLASFGIDAGVIMSTDGRYAPDKKIQVASIQTLNRRNKKPEASLVVIDEAHMAAAKMCAELLGHYREAKIIGLTATPYRLDGKPLGDIFDVLIEAAKYSELIRDGYLIQPTVFAPSQPDLSKIKQQKGDYNEVQLAARMMQTAAISKIIQSYLKLRGRIKGYPTIVFCVNCEHSEMVARAFTAAGVSAISLDHKASNGARYAVLSEFRSGGFDVLCNVALFTQGWDFPRLRCAILARPTMSVALFTQMSGRVLRTYPGKCEAIIIDNAGCVAAHGLPHIDRRFSLTLDAAEQSKDEASSIKVCASCGAVNPRTNKVCSDCKAPFVGQEQRKSTEDKMAEAEEKGLGAVKEIDSNANGLVLNACPRCQLSSGWRSYPKGKFNLWWWCRNCGHGENEVLPPQTTASEKDKIEEYARLESIRRNKGMRPGFTGHKYQDVFGVWPPDKIAYLGKQLLDTYGTSSSL